MTSTVLGGWRRNKQTSFFPFVLCFVAALAFGLLVHLWPGTMSIEEAGLRPRSTWVESLYSAGLQRMGIRAPAFLAPGPESTPVHVAAPLQAVLDRVSQAAVSKAAEDVTTAPDAERADHIRPTLPELAKLQELMDSWCAARQANSLSRTATICRTLIPTAASLDSVLIRVTDRDPELFFARNNVTQYLQGLPTAPDESLGTMLQWRDDDGFSAIVSGLSIGELQQEFPDRPFQSMIRSDAKLAKVELTLKPSAPLGTVASAYYVFFLDAANWHFLDLSSIPWSFLPSKDRRR